MREIVTVLGGQCGNQVGSKFVEMLASEHSIDCTGSSLSDSSEKHVFFRHSHSARFAPRTVLFDLDPNISTRNSAFGHLFSPENFISGHSGAGNNWAKGHYTEGPGIAERVVEVVRREAEGCDALQGFQVCHALGGGTGSGLGSLLLSKLVEEYPSRSIATTSVFPAACDGDCVVHPYNCTFTLPFLSELAHSVLVIENDAMYSICLRRAGPPTFSFRDLNQLIAQGMSGATSTLRCSGDVCSTMLRMHVNLVPFPALHFLSVGISLRGGVGLAETVREVFSTGSRLCEFDSEAWLGALGVFRGFAQDSVPELQGETFVSWIPDSFIVSQQGEGSKQSGTLVGNNTGVRAVLRRTWERFWCLYRRKAFTHWYYGEGMEDMEFQEAACTVQSVIEEYQLLAP